MTKPAAPGDDLLPDDGMTEDLRHKVEEFIEEEEGSFNRYKGWLAAFLTAVAVGTSAFHLYAAYGIVRTDLLRGIHVGLVLFLSFMMFPVAKRFRHRLMWFDVALAILSLVVIGWMIYGGDAFTDRNTDPETWDIVFGIALMVLVVEATRRTSGWIMPIVIGIFLVYAFVGPWLPHPWTHRGYDIGAPRGPHVHDARGHLRHGRRRLGDAHHPVHHLRRLPAVLRRGQVLPRLLLRPHGRQDHQRRARGGALLVPARRAVGLRRGHHGHHRVGGLPDAREGGLRAGRGRGAAGGRGPGRHPLAAGAGRGGLPHRRVPQDLVPRSDQDGDDPDHPLLLLALLHGGARRAQVRHERGGGSAGGRERLDARQALLVPLRVARLDRRLHDDGLLAHALGLLGHRDRLRRELLPARDGAAARRASSRRWRRAPRACSTSRPPAPPRASSWGS